MIKSSSRPHSFGSPHGVHHRGVTLVEVLMALMIMSIGVSAVAVLFPIASLRSIQATQLTNGAIVKYNVEEYVDVNPGLIFDPDGDYNRSAPLNIRRAALAEHFRAVANRNYIVDPAGFHTHLADGNAAFAGTFGNDGSAPLGVPRFGGGVRISNGKTALSGGLTQLELNALRLQALMLANQGDGWETQMDLIPSGVVNHPTAAGAPIVGISFNSDVDLTGVPTLSQALPASGGQYLVEGADMYRMVCFSPDGSLSQAFPLTYVDNATKVALFTEDFNLNGSADTGEDLNVDYVLDNGLVGGVVDFRSLPPEFGGAVSRVLLQSRKVSDYSWMLNVRRRGDGQARSVDVVVRFSDGADLTDEYVYESVFVPSTATGVSRTVWVRNNTAYADSSPNIRKGKFIFDASNGVWYRIQDVQEKPLFPPAGSPFNTFDYLVTVQQPIGASDGAGSLAGPTYAPAMFPSGIVDVYPMGSRNLPESMQVPTF